MIIIPEIKMIVFDKQLKSKIYPIVSLQKDSFFVSVF